MRQVFTSPRLENVEGVQKLLEDAGIATKISQGRSWKGNSRREFSYTAKNHDAGQQPALWVLRPDDFKRARELLHEGGLLEATRKESYLPENLQFREPAANDPARRISRIRMALLAAVAVAFAVMMARIYFG
ncbi:hypothetical protein [Arenimonas composti]|uniref:Pathogenicity-like protein n=1 Tax=Arenimonas composti TR7-09 = DSM 18010 TaxID=1121013 RepID=A0A091BCS7_9GAMM|nr:hypothetical protein [Arenimonas composti]KFN50438.1 hypothetical protein P873_07180 [Arenimonas composti TR7-09 = DSM 18010]